MKLFGLLFDLIYLLIQYFLDNRIKQIVGDNGNGTVTVITQVIYKGEIKEEWDETAKTRFLKEMKDDNKEIGKRKLKEYNL